MPDWVRLKEGYFCAAQAKSVSVACFCDTPKELAFQLMLNWQTEAGYQTAYVYVDESQCTVSRSCIRQDVGHNVKHYEFLTLCPVRMYRFAQQQAMFEAVSRHNKGFDDTFNLFGCDHKNIAIAVGILCFVLWTVLNSSWGLAFLTCFLLFKKTQLYIQMGLLEGKRSKSCQKILRLLEVGGLHHLDETRQSCQPGKYVLRKSIKFYLGLLALMVFFSWFGCNGALYYLLLLIKLVFCQFYFEVIRKDHVSGKRVFEASNQRLTPRGVMNLLDRTCLYEKKNVCQLKGGPSFFNPRVGIDCGHVVLTVSWSPSRHTSLFTEECVGGNHIKTSKLDCGFLSSYSSDHAGSARLLGNRAEKVWNGIQSGCEQIEMVLTNRQVVGYVDYKEVRNLKKKENCKTRSIVVSEAAFRKLRSNMKKFSSDSSYRARDKNCLIQTFWLLDSIGVLPIDLRAEMDREVPSFSVGFRTNDDFKQYALQAGTKKFLR